MWDLGARGPVSDPAERSGATNGNKAIWGTVDTKGHFPGSETTPHPTGSSQHLHSLPRASHPPLPPHLHPRSPFQSDLPRSAGPPVRRSAADPNSPSRTHLATPVPFTLSFPRGEHDISQRGGLYPEPGWGGAGRSRAEPVASPGSRPTLGSTALPAGEERTRLRRAKVRWL